MESQSLQSSCWLLHRNFNKRGFIYQECIQMKTTENLTSSAYNKPEFYLSHTIRILTVHCQSKSASVISIRTQASSTFLCPVLSMWLLPLGCNMTVSVSWPQSWKEEERKSWKRLVIRLSFLESSSGSSTQDYSDYFSLARNIWGKWLPLWEQLRRWVLSCLFCIPEQNQGSIGKKKGGNGYCIGY